MEKRISKQFDLQLGAKARAIRQSREMSLADVVRRSREVGHLLSKNRLSELERGLHSWTTRNIAAVSDGLGIEPAYLASAIA